MPENEPKHSRKTPIALLCRHGKDTLSDSGIYVSWIDAPLTAEGMEQAHELVEFVADYSPTRVYSSPLQRAFNMAVLLAGNEKHVTQTRDLLPWNRGILTGTLESEGKELLKLFLKNPDMKVPYGESRNECEERLWNFFDPLFREAREDGPFVFFTHHSVIDVLNILCTGERGEEPYNLVKAGGCVGVYPDGEGDYRLEALLKPDNEAVTGMS